jgi:quinol monooxygenase YgiN
MKSLTVVATFQSRPGKESDLRTALTGLLAPTRKESGCLNYDLHQSPDDATRFLFHENWTDKASLDVHLRSPHIMALRSRVGELCVALPEVKIWERIG